MSIHYLEELSCGPQGEISLNIRWNASRIIVHLTHSPSNPSIENTFIARYAKACGEDDLDNAEDISNEILDAVVGYGRDLFDAVAPSPAPGSSPSKDLHTLLFPQQHNFYFRTVNDEIQVSNIDRGEGCSPVLLGRTGLPFHLNTVEDFNLPTFSTKEICVLENLVDDGYIAHVQVGKREMCSKAGDNKGEDAAQRELDCLWKITSSSCSATLRVPKLLGLIKTPDNDRIVGFLEEYIAVAEDWELSTLGNIDDPLILDESRRKKWAMQVQETIAHLHEIGVIWGDGKASNVLISRETDDAWVIDFGGSWTEGWVPEELSGTMQGDDLAVEKLFEFLQVKRMLLLEMYRIPEKPSLMPAKRGHPEDPAVKTFHPWH